MLDCCIAGWLDCWIVGLKSAESEQKNSEAKTTSYGILGKTSKMSKLREKSIFLLPRLSEWLHFELF